MAKKKRDPINEPWIENYPPLANWLRDVKAFCHWQIGYGPKNTPSMYVEQWMFPGGNVAIIVVRADQHGWDIFTNLDTNNVTPTLADAERRLRLNMPPAATPPPCRACAGVLAQGVAPFHDLGCPLASKVVWALGTPDAESDAESKEP